MRKFVVVITEQRSVWAGWTTDELKSSAVTLYDARNCLFWPSEIGGVGGLATFGPIHGARIGAVVPSYTTVRAVAVLGCSEAAIAAWQEVPTYVGK